MIIPNELPPWVPWWLPFLILALGILYLFAFLLMPFSVFGLKGRLEGIEARLDEIQAEVRQLALRFPEYPRSAEYEEEPFPLPYARSDAEMRRSSISAGTPGRGAGTSIRSATSLDRASDLRALAPGVRAEPHLDWPP